MMPSITRRKGLSGLGISGAMFDGAWHSAHRKKWLLNELVSRVALKPVSLRR